MGRIPALRDLVGRMALDRGGHRSSRRASSRCGAEVVFEGLERGRSEEWTDGQLSSARRERRSLAARLLRYVRCPPCDCRSCADTCEQPALWPHDSNHAQYPHCRWRLSSCKGALLRLPCSCRSSADEMVRHDTKCVCLPSVLELEAHHRTVGRISNRLTNDVGIADKELSMALRSFLATLLSFVASIGVVIWLVPAFAPAAFVILYGYWRLAEGFRCAYRDIRRLEFVAWSPMFSRCVSAITAIIRSWRRAQLRRNASWSRSRPRLRPLASFSRSHVHHRRRAFAPILNIGALKVRTDRRERRSSQMGSWLLATIAFRPSERPRALSCHRPRFPIRRRSGLCCFRHSYEQDVRCMSASV